MEIILKEDVIGLGYKNDIVNVKSGYGRNYLIPYGKGVIASDSAKKQLAEDLKQKAVKLAKVKAEAEALAQKLGFEINRKTIIVKDVKTVGEYVAVVKLHKEVSAEVPFTVLAEGETAAPAAEEATEAPAEAAAETPAEA